MTDKRASIFDNPNPEENPKDPEATKLDLGGFTPRKSSRVIDKGVVEAVASESGFQSREPKLQQIPATHTLRNKVLREDQLSARIQRDHFELFYKIVNLTGKKNAEILEHAIECYADKLGIK